MSVTLQDPVGPRDPSAAHSFPQFDQRSTSRLTRARTHPKQSLAGFRPGSPRFAGRIHRRLGTTTPVARTEATAPRGW
jgi:hypothetical protein